MERFWSPSALLKLEFPWGSFLSSVTVQEPCLHGRLQDLSLIIWGLQLHWWHKVVEEGKTHVEITEAVQM